MRFKLAFNEVQQTRVIAPSDIVSIEADGTSSKVFFWYKGEITCHDHSKPIGFIEDALEEMEAFVRIHQSYIINMDHVLTIHQADSQRAKVEMEGLQELIPASRNYKYRLKMNLKEI